LWVVLAGAGVALLGLDAGDDEVQLAGLALALLAGLCWAGYILASARVGRLVPGVDGLAVALLVGAVLALPFGAEGASRAFTVPSALIAGVAVALLSSIIPYGLELSALRRIPTRVFGVLMSLEPAAAALAGLAVLDQRLGGRELLALALVSLASLGVTLGRRDSKRPVAPHE
ncbi:MAG: EamA family transporter, partial [Actinomycetes bacterium]